jgi:uncharacterized protein YjiS (DUF1127 family)
MSRSATLFARPAINFPSRMGYAVRSLAAPVRHLQETLRRNRTLGHLHALDDHLRQDVGLPRRGATVRSPDATMLGCGRW